MTTEADLPTEEFETEWHNYGDVNPEPHGGRFVRWDDDSGYFRVVEINRAGAVSADHDDEPGEYYVTDITVYPDNIWENGDPENGFTDDMESILESLGDEHYKEAPGAEPFMSRVEYYVADMTHYLHDSQRGFEQGEFEEVLASHGVDDWE